MINKIVFTSPEAMVEFSVEKIKPPHSSKPFEHMQINIRLKGQLRDLFSLDLDKQKSPITNHATTLCKECELKPLYNPGSEPALNHAISIVSTLLNCFRVMFSRKTLLLNIT